MIFELNLPKYNFTYLKETNKIKIFDIIRKKYVILTPEEWVRQNIVHYIIKAKNFPKSLLSVERTIKINDRFKRYDIVLFNNNGDVDMLIECKSPLININKTVLEQALKYNYILNVPFLLITNGMKHFCIKINYQNNSYEYLNKIPSFNIKKKCLEL